MEHNERDTYRAKVVFRDKRTGQEVVKYTKSYDSPATAKGQGTYKVRSWERSNLEWVRTELQKADWQTVETKKV